MTALDPSTQGIEAQKLISISLGKMAASRVGKSGSSLHKSLLVASVLQRARHVFLEENYHNYHYRGPTIAPVPIYAPHVPPPPPCEPPAEVNDENRCATPQPQQEEVVPQTPKEEGTVPRMPLGDASNQQQQRVVALKRRRCVSDKETQDAVSSILPKRFRSSSESVSCSSSSPEEEDTSSCTSALPVCTASNLLLPISAADSENELPSPVCAREDVLPQSENVLPESPRDHATTNPIYCTLEPISDDEEDDDDVNSMEVEHITSLVSIFSFGAPRKDLCATQAAREDHAQFTPVALAV